MVSVSPAWAGAGATLVSAGMGLNRFLLVEVPPPFVTAITPTGASAGTLAMSLVAVTATSCAVAPANDTVVVVPKLLPAIETSVPARPLVGVNPVIAGSGSVLIVQSPAAGVGSVFPAWSVARTSNVCVPSASPL